MPTNEQLKPPDPNLHSTDRSLFTAASPPMAEIISIRGPISIPPKPNTEAAGPTSKTPRPLIVCCDQSADGGKNINPGAITTPKKPNTEAAAPPTKTRRALLVCGRQSPMTEKISIRGPISNPPKPNTEAAAPPPKTRRPLIVCGRQSADGGNNINPGAHHKPPKATH